MTADLAALKRVLSRTALRLRVQRALGAATWALTVAALLATACRLWAPLSFAAWWGLLLGLPLATALICGAWPLPRLTVAALLDLRGELEGRLSAAVALLHLSSRSPFEEAALRDANRHADARLPERAAPLRVPRASLPVLLALLILRFAPDAPPTVVAPAPRRAPEAPTRLLDVDELASLRVSDTQAPVSATYEQARREYDSLLAELAAGVVPGEQAVARALRLENELLAGEQPDLEALRALARSLQRARPALARALSEDLSAAAEELRKLSREVREQKLDSAARKQLSAALEEARRREHERLAARQAEAEKSLLKRKNDKRAPSAGQAGAERRLETLRRDDPQAHELEQLARELGEAGAALSQQQSEAAADSLQNGASTLDRMEQERRATERQRELSEAVAQLRELLQRRALEQQRAQQQQSADDEQASSEQRRQRFSQRARGEPIDGGSASGQAAPGGAGQGERAASVQLPAPAPALVVPVRTSSPGSEHDPGKQSAPTRARSDYQDQRLLGVEGTGPTRSQLIRSAAASGFAQQGYRKVYGDYRAFAETVLERDQVPPGQRFFVRRYFELVRPREGQAPP